MKCLNAWAVSWVVALLVAGGCTGKKGKNGLNGDPGIDGNNGADGANGANGKDGKDGKDGTGAAGAAGAGPQGPAGDVGPPGLTGEPGAPGPAVVLSTDAKQGLDISPVPIDLTGLTSDQIQAVGHGSYLVNAIGDCTGCHTSDLSKFLAGGVPFTIPGAGASGSDLTVYTRNLTPDETTGLSDIDEDQFIDVMRTGADFDTADSNGVAQQTLAVMPWLAFRWLSTDDIKSIYAYLQQIPAIENAVPEDENKDTPPPEAFGDTYTAGDQSSPVPLPPETDMMNAAVPDPGHVLRGLAINPLEEVIPPTDPTEMALFGRGSYLVNALADCSGCHTNRDDPMTGNILTSAYLTGGQVFDTPPPLQTMPMGTVRAASANLVGETNGYFNESTTTFQTFESLITQGYEMMMGEKMMLAFPMPWQAFRHMELSDLQAVYTYMHEVATQYGATTLTGDADKMVPQMAMYCDGSMSPTGCMAGTTCSSDSGPGECLADDCTVDTDCAACQTCDAGSCAVLTGTDLAMCEGAGY